MNNITDNTDLIRPCIYMLKNKLNGKIYIGSTKNGIESRMRHHTNVRSRCIKLKRALEKYGKDAFDVTIVEHCSLGDLIKREQYWLDFYLPFDDRGYNICRFAGHTLGHRHTEETKQKIRLAVIGNKNMLGHKHSDATKLKISQQGCTPETRLKMRLKRLGKPLSEETKRRMSESRMGMKFSPERSQKMWATRRKNAALKLAEELIN